MELIDRGHAPNTLLPSFDKHPDRLDTIGRMVERTPTSIERQPRNRIASMWVVGMRTGRVTATIELVES